MERVDATLLHQGVAATNVVTAAGRAGLLEEAEKELTEEGWRAVTVGLRQMQRLDEERKVLAELIRKAAMEQPACRALVEELYGAGWLLAYVIWAELGDVRRFSSSREAVRYAGIDVTVYASGDHRSMGSLSRQGSPVLRWAPYEAALAASHKSSPDHAYYVRVKDRRGDDGGITLQRSGGDGGSPGGAASAPHRYRRRLPQAAWAFCPGQPD